MKTHWNFFADSSQIHFLDCYRRMSLVSGRILAKTLKPSALPLAACQGEQVTKLSRYRGRNSEATTRGSRNATRTKKTRRKKEKKQNPVKKRQRTVFTVLVCPRTRMWHMTRIFVLFRSVDCRPTTVVWLPAEGMVDGVESVLVGAVRPMTTTTEHVEKK